MNKAVTITVVFLGGFNVMVLEIVGARFLATEFGSSFYVWISQIGVVLIALALGYWIGGALADRCQKLLFLGLGLMVAGILTGLIPNYAKGIVEAIVLRHPMDAAIPVIWKKLDPAIGSALIFLAPCFILASLAPYTIRISTKHIGHVGSVSGAIYAASTVGSIAGVFVAGYLLIDLMRLSQIFRLIGGLTILLGLACFWLDRMNRQPSESSSEP